MIIQAMQAMMTPINILLMFGGVAVGTIFGAIPGLTGAIAIAIFLPMTYYMESMAALALLIGIYVGGSFGGSIPAILIGTPGAPEAGITTFDGAPLARNGKGGKALKTALYASCAGNFLSSITTILMMSALARLALLLGPSEYCSIVLFSIVLIATIGSKGNWIKGLFAVMLGLAFALVGTDPMIGIPRFTFGFHSLNTGLELIPVLVGLFVGGEMLGEVRISSRRKSLTKIIKNENRFTKDEIKSCIPVIFTGSAIGSVIGALPGLNAAISATLNYALAKKISKQPGEFGNGSVTGIAASEAANNGTVGPTLVPLLTLGIPGSGTAAIFLGALTLHGVTVGPTIFQEHGDVVYGIFFALMFCTLALAIVGTVICGFAKYVTLVPAEILDPIIILVCCAGSYSISKRLFDVGCMMVFMLFGWLMKEIRIPMLPLLIAFLLGSMLETNFRRSLQINQNTLRGFASPLSVVFLVITAAMLVYAVAGSMAKKKKSE